MAANFHDKFDKAFLFRHWLTHKLLPKQMLNLPLKLHIDIASIKCFDNQELEIVKASPNLLRAFPSLHHPYRSQSRSALLRRHWQRAFVAELLPHLGSIINANLVSFALYISVYRHSAMVATSYLADFQWSAEYNLAHALGVSHNACNSQSHSPLAGRLHQYIRQYLHQHCPARPHQYI